MSSNFDYELVRSGRRSISVEIKKGGRIIVRAPQRMSAEGVERFLYQKSAWIEKHLRIQLGYSADFDFDRYGKKEITELKAKAREVIFPLVEHYKTLLEVQPSAVKINAAKKRFGSCSAKNSLNFSCFLVLYPMPAIEYVTVHELCHIKEHNHSKNFYRHIESVMPDYRERERVLSEYNGGEK